MLRTSPDKNGGHFVIGYTGLGLDMKSSKLSLLLFGLFYWSLCFAWGHAFPLGKLLPFSLPYNGIPAADTLYCKAWWFWARYHKHDDLNDPLQENSTLTSRKDFHTHYYI